MADSPVVMVKFRRADDPARQQAVLREHLGRRLVRVRQLFPGDAEEALATIFEVVVRDGGSLGPLLASLQGDERVEYAHEPAERRPARS